MKPTSVPAEPTLSPAVFLRPPITAASYQATITWETFVNGDYQASTIEKKISLHVQPNKDGYALSFHTGPPQLVRAAGLAALDDLALRLAALYEQVAVQAAPTGEFSALLNHRALLQTWDRLAQQIAADTPEEDILTINILLAVGQQLFEPTDFIRALQNDYLYQALLPLAHYHYQVAGSSNQLVSRAFANFFDKTTLWFSERATVLPAEQPGQLWLRLQGALDTHQTDITAVKRLIAKELALLPPPAGHSPLPADLPAPHFSYNATYLLAADTGLPLQAELGVSARVGQMYNKEYTLLITRQ